MHGERRSVGLGLGVVALVLNVLLASRCTPGQEGADGGVSDGSFSDAGPLDAGPLDAWPLDAGDPQLGTLFALPDGLYVTEKVDGSVRLHGVDEAGRRLVRIAELPGVSHQWVGQRVGSRFVFSAEGTEVGAEVWQTDGTEAGTGLLADIHAGPNGSSPQLLSVHGGRLYFVADDGIHGEELWRTDGTAAGTELVADAFAGTNGSGPVLLGVLGDRVVFAANGLHGHEPRIWSPEGGLELLGDLIADAGTNALSKGAQLAGQVYFTAKGTEGRWQMWQTDGTSAGTKRAFESELDAFLISPVEATGGSLVFVGWSGMWRWVPGEASPELVTPHALPGQTVFREPDRFFYSFYVEAHGPLWFETDGTDGGSRLHPYPTRIEYVQGSRVYKGPECCSSTRRSWASRNDRDFFLRGLSEIWVTDGTSAGTHQIL